MDSSMAGIYLAVGIMLAWTWDLFIFYLVASFACRRINSFFGYLNRRREAAERTAVKSKQDVSSDAITRLR